MIKENRKISKGKIIMGKRKNKKQNLMKEISAIFAVICILIFGYINKNLIPLNGNETENIAENSAQSQIGNTIESTTGHTTGAESVSFDLSTIPQYENEPYVVINNNIPYFSEDDYTKEAFENYSELDILGRSGVAFANICKEIMPKEGEERGEIGSIKDLTRLGAKEI